MTEARASTDLPITIIVTADDGGTGKTVFATQIAAFARLNNVQIAAYQLDSKDKLAAKTGLEVTSLSIGASRNNADEIVASDIIAPWYSAVTGQDRTSTMLEVGGANAALFHAGIAEFDFEEDIQYLNIDVRTFVLCKAGEDSARQAVREVRRLEANIPGSKVIIVKNEMHGCPVAAATHFDSALRRDFLNLLKKYPSIRLPKVRLRSMALYERLHVPPDAVVSWHKDGYREAMVRTSCPRPEAKLFVKDIAAWTGTIFDELTLVLSEWVSDHE